MRGVIRFLLGLVVVLAIVWVGLWWYAEGRMESGFTAWADQLAAQGWKIGYTSDQRGTSPMQAKLTLTNLTLSPPPGADGRTGTITLPTFALRIDVLNPLVLHTDLPNRINLDIGSDIDAAITFGSIVSTQQLDPHVLFARQSYPFRTGDASASNIDILASQGSLLVLHIDQFNAHAEGNPAAGADSTAAILNESFDGIAVSPLMTRLLSIPYDGKITHLALGLSLSGPVPPDLQKTMAQFHNIPPSDEAAQRKLLAPIVHNWAAQGGNGKINLAAMVGPTTLTADAAVKFDTKQQPAGTANLTADHLDQLFATLANAYPEVQAYVAQGEAQLSQYITSTSQGGQTLAMHVVYGNGAINVNGQKVAPMPPVDWNALENPPAPPSVTAPNDGSGANLNNLTPPPSNAQ